MNHNLRRGQRIGKLILLRQVKNSIYWVCRCDCGNVKEVSKYMLWRTDEKRTQSCGCLAGKHVSEKRKNLRGKRIGKLEVIKDAEKVNKWGRPVWICRCDCGNELEIPSSYLLKKLAQTTRSQKKESCGCSPRKTVKDLTKRRSGKLKVIGYAYANKHGKAVWKCRCDCGNECLVGSREIITKHTQSCGKNCPLMKAENSTKRMLKIRRGKKFGRLRIIKSLGMMGKKQQMWLCKCRCGKDVIIPTTYLTAGSTQSCGCLKSDVVSDRMSASLWAGLGEHSSIDHLKEEIQKEKRRLQMC